MVQRDAPRHKLVLVWFPWNYARKIIKYLNDNPATRTSTYNWKVKCKLMFASESVKPFKDEIVSDVAEDRREAANDSSVPRMFQKDIARLGLLDAVI